MRQGVVPAPPVDELLPDPASQARFEEVAAALEAADLVRRMRRQALSVHGTAGITQEELARRSGLSQPRISQIESSAGRDGLSYAVLRRIAHACGINWGAMLRDGLDRAAKAATRDGVATPDVTKPIHAPSKRADSLPAAADRMIAEVDAEIGETWTTVSAVLRTAVDDFYERLKSTNSSPDVMATDTMMADGNLGADVAHRSMEDVSSAVVRTFDVLNKLRDLAAQTPDDAEVRRLLASGLFNAFNNAGTAERADSLLQELRDLFAQTPDDAEIRRILASGLVNAFNKAGTAERADSLLQGLRDLGRARSFPL